jgi:phage N-6-adenine-methyltransferase
MSADLFGAEVPDRRAMGSHQSHSGGADEWLTPPDLLTALGGFDLDPCAPIDAPWSTAAKHYTIEDDGLRQPWEGRVWLNPPYSTADRWLARLVEHGRGTALIFARTETRLWFEQVWPYATGLLFLRGRLHFHYPNGARAKANSGAPSVLIAYGERDAQVLASKPWPGHFVELDNSPHVNKISLTPEARARRKARLAALRGGDR